MLRGFAINYKATDRSRRVCGWQTPVGLAVASPQPACSFTIHLDFPTPTERRTSAQKETTH